ncbi:metallophosphoesterase family protein [Deinococcus lacus]|uniref:Metallophosphoesterase family protein n=1 Tax=Deinococcus lacus TaxID=392561 RepID=A0ABW1YGY0_9DEIO
MRRLLFICLVTCLACLGSVGADPLRVVILSDFNGPYGSVTYPAPLGAAVRHILADPPNLVLSAGDLIAGQKPALSDAQVRAMWAGFETEVAAPLRTAGIPLAAALGNHDAAQARDRREAARYWQAHPPAAELLDGQDFPFQYTFRVRDTAGRTLWGAVLDAPGPALRPGAVAWLRRQLTSEAAQAAQVRLVVGHLPLSGISAGKNAPGEVLRPGDAAALALALQEGGVLAYVSGHHAAAYAGRLAGPQVNVLASGGIGGRDYLGQPGSARDTVLDLELDLAGGEGRVRIRDAQTWATVPLERLPTHLSGLGGRLERLPGGLLKR